MSKTDKPDAMADPTLLEQRITALPPDRRRLLEKMLQERARPSRSTAAKPPHPLPRQAQHYRARLSLAQQRVWIIEQLNPGTSLYCEASVLRLARTAPPEVVAQAIEVIAHRHAILRTRFLADPEPCQVIARDLSPTFRVEVLDSLPEPARVQAFERLARADATRPFDLAVGPPIRATLAVLGPDDQRLILVLHHLVCDGWSLGVIAAELALMIEAHATGGPPPLPPLPLQYADFAEWQRVQFEQPATTREAAAWTDRLRDIPALELPSTGPRPAVPSYRGARLRFALSPTLVTGVQALAASCQVTPFTVLLTGFALLLWRHARQQLFAIGVPVSGRHRVELEGLVGFFINTLPIRFDITGESSVRDLVRVTASELLTAFQRQDVPVEFIIERLGRSRDASRNPLFQTAFQLFTPPSAPGLDPKVLPRVDWLDNCMAKFDLRIEVHALPDGWSGFAEYATDLFDADEISAMVAQYRALLSAMIADAAAPVGTLPLINAEEGAAIVAAGQAYLRPLPEPATITGLFARMLSSAPHAPAIEDGGITLTYVQLHQRASLLASRLRGLGIDRDVPVGLCLRGGSELVVAMLAALQAGGCYLPLDPSYPEARLRFMLEDSGAPIVLTTAEFRSRVPAGPTILLYEDEGETLRPSTPEPAPSDIAYITYTSGSTGLPKGVETPHAAVARLVRNCDYLAVKPGMRIALAATPQFDALTFEVWGALLNGGTVVVLPREDLLDADALASRLRGDRMDAIFVTTDLFHRIAIERPDTFASVQAVLFGGSAGDLRHARAVQTGSAPARLLHVYGPTECTTFATWFDLAELSQQARLLPIGRPIGNTEAHVLDERGFPVANGVPGELYLGGPGLARGYRNRPEATAAAFVLHPFDSKPGARLYRTGDIVRRDAAGLLHFIGRQDDQVKIRGFRVEPREVEAVLRRQEGVSEAFVLAREDAPGKKRLVGYVAGRGLDADLAGLRESLTAQLPEYMLPSALVKVDVLPLTPNGKVDAAALPTPEAPRERSTAGHVAPRNDRETMLAAIWAGLLGLSQVSVEDNFFELGGDSIVSLQVMARARQAGLHLSARQFFQNQTIAGQARVASTTADTAAQIAPADAPVSRDAIPLTPIQRWFFATTPTDPHHFNHALLLQLDDASRVEQAAAAATALLVERHEALRLRFAQKGVQWRQTLASSGDRAGFSRIDLSGISSAGLPRAIEDACAAAQGSLDLAAGPLFRVLLLDAGPGRAGRLLLLAHHLVVDGVSWRILLEDFFALFYQGRRDGTAASAASTAGFSAWAHHLAEDAERRRDASAWVAALKEPVVPLPHDLPGTLNLVADAAQVVVRLDPDQTRGLLQETPRRTRATITTVLLAAFADALAGWTGQRRLLIDLETHGREGIEPPLDLSRSVGWFTAVHPVPIGLGEGTDAAARVRDLKAALAALPSPALSYGQLRWMRRDPESNALATAPHAEVSFNYLGRFATYADAGIRLADESSGPLRSPRQQREYLIEVDALTQDDVFEARLTYPSTMLRRETVTGLARSFMQSLRAVNAAAVAQPELFVAPSDFERAKLSQKDLERIARRLGARDGEA